MTVLLIHGHGKVAVAQDTAARPTFLITPRINSAGYFPFTGAYLNKHANVDVNFFYEYKGNGFFIFKSHDLEDSHSIVNYLQPGIFKTFQINLVFRLRAFFGYLFSQTNGFKDEDSDYYSAVTAYWDVSSNVRVENCLLYFDMISSPKVANRLFIRTTLKNFKIDLYLWDRFVFENKFNCVSASLAVNPPPLKISESISIQGTVSYMGYLGEAKPDYAMHDGWVVTVAFPIAVKI